MKISKHSNGYYRTTIRTPDGKYKSVYGKTKREVKEKINKLIAEIENDEWVAPNETIYSVWSKLWLDSLRNTLKPRTIETYESHIRNYILPVFGNKKLQDITHLDCQKLSNDLLERLAPKTVNNVISTLSKSFEYAVNNDLINKNPARNLTLPKVIKKEKVILSEDQIKPFIKCCYEHSIYGDLIEFALLTGMRQSEIIGLTIDKYDQKTQSILIDRQLVKVNRKYQFVTPKHDVIRRIVICDKAKEIVENRIRKTINQRKYFKDFNPTGFVFTNDLGFHASHASVAEAVKRQTERLGIKGVTFHSLRHTYATIADRTATDPKTVQNNLGHKSLNFTLNVYSHSTEQMQKQSAENLENFIENL